VRKRTPPKPETPPQRVCRKCLRPLGRLDGPARDWRCLACRHESTPGDQILVCGFEYGLLVAVQYLESRRIAEQVAFAWKRAKLEVKVVEPSQSSPGVPLLSAGQR
jgi:hypothetical protein